MRSLIAGLALGLTMAGGAGAATTDGVSPRGLADDQHPVYVQIIVKACPAAETPLTLEERKASFVSQGCIDVPIPMEWITGGMTPQACRGHAGYVASMQFLEQRQDLKGFSAVGAWSCLVTEHEVVGAINQ